MEEADAHECLSALLDAMHEGSLASMKTKPPPQELADTFVHRIFGGLIKTQVSLFIESVTMCCDEISVGAGLALLHVSGLRHLYLC